MAEYIEKDKAINAVFEAFADGRSAYIALEALPTEDVVPLRHGRNISNSGFLCSECHFGDFGGFHGYNPNYCPNCGAKMDGEA